MGFDPESSRPDFRHLVCGGLAGLEHEDSLLENRGQRERQIKSIVDDLDVSVFGLVRDIRGAIADDGLSATRKVEAIRSLLCRESRSPSFESLKADLDAAGKDRDCHHLLERGSQYLRNRLSPILCTVMFEHIDRATQLGEAVDHFRAADGCVDANAPTGFSGAGERSALYGADGEFRIPLYKVFLFQHVTSAIRFGDLDLAHSHRYRPNSPILDRFWRHPAMRWPDNTGSPTPMSRPTACSAPSGIGSRPAPDPPPAAPRFWPASWGWAVASAYAG